MTDEQQYAELVGQSAAVEAIAAAARDARVAAGPASAPPRSLLSPREQEVLKWVAAGKSDHDIATILTVSVNTVAYHMRNIFLKLKVNNRVTAVVVAITQGLIEI